MIGNLKKAALILEDGTIFFGSSFGYEGDAQGEIVFNTSMAGYQEILTDPSYKGQIVVMTYPLIGNYGCNEEDVESSKPWVEGFVIKEPPYIPFNWRKKESLEEYLIRKKIPGIFGIDTRKLTKIIRTHGAQNAIISTTTLDYDLLIKKVRSLPSIVGIDMVKYVTSEKPYEWKEGIWEWKKGYGKRTNFKYFVVAYDFGIKRNILRNLVSYGIRVYVVPAKTSCKEILDLNPDGVFLSNGPGDPEPVSYAIENIKNMIGRLPIFGICLGHQLLALALEGKTYKLKFGHHGGNHPVKNIKKNAIEITTQNHNFAVNPGSLKQNIEITHINLNDYTVEGLSLKEKFLFSVQYHPESSPGPRDSRYLFDEFVKLIQDFKREKVA
ncbi:MAG: glutamine-hydrolyzing carbamoyl-phosphate synthase small subunit [Acidobacteriota bacterium]